MASLRDQQLNDQLADARQREKLIRAHLSKTSQVLDSPQAKSRGRSRRKRDVLRAFVADQVYVLIHGILHAVFSLYIRLRRTYHFLIHCVLALRYHHYRTPDYIRHDVRNLHKLPEHLSVILEARHDQSSRIDSLYNNAGEVAAWTASAGVQKLSIYEETGTA